MHRFNKWISILLILVASVSWAQKKGADKKKRSKKVMVSFDEDLVEGNMTGSELFLILQKKQSKFEQLFELRENFIPEMRTNVEAIE